MVRFVAVAVTICLDLLKTDFVTRSCGEIGPQHAGCETVPSEFPNLPISRLVGGTGFEPVTAGV